MRRDTTDPGGSQPASLGGQPLARGGGGRGRKGPGVGSKWALPPTVRDQPGLTRDVARPSDKGREDTGAVGTGGHRWARPGKGRGEAPSLVAGAVGQGPPLLGRCLGPSTGKAPSPGTGEAGPGRMAQSRHPRGHSSRPRQQDGAPARAWPGWSGAQDTSSCPAPEASVGPAITLLGLSPQQPCVCTGCSCWTQMWPFSSSCRRPSLQDPPPSPVCLGQKTSIY